MLQDRAGKKIADRQRLLSIAQGFDPSYGSNLQLAREVAEASAIEASNKKFGFDLQASRFQHQASRFGEQARFMRQRAEGIDPDTAFTNSLLASGANFASSWYGKFDGSPGGKTTRPTLPTTMRA